uniref:Uncharacterized protein n=1 Tax=Rhizophora mucronata TaxID=61149 RepID=A0A2P2QG90_RHIMU
MKNIICSSSLELE